MTTFLPPDLSALDAFAFVWLLVLWSAYNLAVGRLGRRIPTINEHMRVMRYHWMQRFLERDNRIMDSQLLGHTIHSVTFFASTSMLVMAGLIGVFGALDAAYDVVDELSFAVRTSKEFFEMKLLVVVGVFAFGFFKFTWALRQYNYTCAMMGSAPLCPVDEHLRHELAGTMADAITSAISAFNGGLRSYYFALAVLTWFIHPWLFIGATAWVVALLLYRQLGSKFFHTAKRHGILVETRASETNRSPGRMRNGEP